MRFRQPCQTFDFGLVPGADRLKQKYVQTQFGDVRLLEIPHMPGSVHEGMLHSHGRWESQLT